MMIRFYFFRFSFFIISSFFGDAIRKRKGLMIMLVPKNNQQNEKIQGKSDGIDVEFSEELADQEDKEAQARSNAADQRQKKK